MEYKRPGFEIEAGHGGAIAMLIVPDEMASHILNWGKNNIDDHEVYGKDGKGRGGSPHVTVQNGILCDDADELEKLFSELESMEVELGSVSVFRQDDKDYDVVHVEVLGDCLHDANLMVSDLLEVNNVHKEYNPHITIAYVKKGAGHRFEGLNDFSGKKMVLDKMVIDGGNIDTRMIPLAKPTKTEPSDRSDYLHGGKADHMSESEFDSKDVEEGAKHELEHTKNIEIAREIAMDHLAEDPDYYKKLNKVEAESKCKHSKNGKWCGRCEPLKESLDYGPRKAAYDAEDLEDYLLDSGRSINSLSNKEAKNLLSQLRNEH